MQAGGKAGGQRLDARQVKREQIIELLRPEFGAA